MPQIQDLNLGEKSDIPLPAEVYLFMDAGSYVISPFEACWWSDPKAPSGSYYLPGIGGLGVKPRTSTPITSYMVKDFMDGRHSGNVNVAFCDGHASYVKDQVIQKEAMIACANDQTNQPKAPNAWEKYP